MDKQFINKGTFQLDSLDLSYNHLTRVPHVIFTYMPTLVSLSLKGNPISTVDGGDFSSLHMLKKLDISFCKISLLSSDFLGRNPQIIFL